MKKKQYFFIGLAFGLLIGWAFGFIRVPYIENNTYFWVGFVAALAMVSLVPMLLLLWNSTWLNRFAINGTEIVPNTRTHVFVWVLLIGVPALGGLAGLLVFRQQTQSMLRQIQIRDQKMQKMEAAIQSGNNNNLAPLMHDMLEGINKALKQSPYRSLNDSVVAQIAALSRLFKPYQYFGEDSLSEWAYSPERGQMLKALMFLDLDTSTFGQIKRKALFAGADLRQIDFKGADLSGINLNGANLKDAILRGANLKGANLEKASLWGTNLNGADLSNANLKKADLSWAKLNETTMIGTNLNGAVLINTQFIKSMLKDVSMMWARCDGALFNEASLAKVNFTGAQLVRANLDSARVSDTYFKKVDLSGATLVGMSLHNVFVDENWLEKLEKWRPAGMKALQVEYRLVNDTVDNGKRPLYRLKRNVR